MENAKMTEWQKVKLGDICDVRDGTHDSPKQSLEGKFLVTSKHIKGGKIDLSSAYKISLEDFNFVNQRSKVEQWDILISMIGTVGEICLICTPPDFAIKNVGLIKTGNKDLAQYLFYYLKSPISQNDIETRLKGTTQQYLSLSEIRDFPVFLPPLEIQRKIAGILGALDDQIDVLRRENVVLEQMAQAVFQSWFVDFDIVRAKAAGTPESEVCEKYHITPELYALFPSALTPDDLPLGWEKKKLGDLAFNASETHTAQDVEKLIFINTSDVKNGVFLHNKYSVRSEMPGQAKKSIKENDILYSEIRPINKHFAFVNFDSKDYIVSTKFMIIRSFDINNVFYIYFFLTLKETLNSFQALAENRSGTFPQITFESISKTEIVFSNRELHWYFSDYLKKTYTKIFENEKQIRTLSATRDALLPKLMNGEIEV